MISLFFVRFPILIPVVALILSIIVKAILEYFAGRGTWNRAFGSGGMPSVHSALVTSVTTSIGIERGYSDYLFIFALVVSSIIIYDAINVRFEAGRHAKVLNALAQDTSGPFNEFIGHKPVEALVGSIIGIATAVVLLTY